MMDAVLRIRNLSKTFPGVQALKNVQLEVKRGSVHALMGENGAGKSTFVKILYGLYQPDAGAVIELDGKPFHPTTPFDALKQGISIVPQEVSPVPNISLAANFYLGREVMRGPLLDERAMAQQARAVFTELGLQELLGLENELMKDLPVAQAQMLSIANAVTHQAQVIVLDEPTTALTEAEVQRLFHIIRTVNQRGIAFIYISHKLDEIFSIAEDVTVFRDGSFIATEKVAGLTKSDLIRMMIGRKVEDFFVRKPLVRPEVLLRVEHLSAGKRFQDVSFELHAGEILGVAGLMGAGRTELLEAIFGYVPAEGGDMSIRGQHVRISNPQDAMRHGFGFITEDRKLTGLFLNMSVKDNVVMPCLKNFLVHGWLSYRKQQQVVGEQKNRLRIKTPSLGTIINDLSGGNQQKALIARWMLLSPDILLMDEPTKGIDVGAKYEICLLMEQLASEGKGIVLVSSDMPELLAMSDRILVLHGGVCSGIIPGQGATQEQVLALATGEELSVPGC